MVPVIADTRDTARIDALFARHRPDVVVHAAAHKHVPLMEWNPEEAVTNNVGGTRNIVQTCERYNVQTFVMISTDKAVNPTSTMGATKRIAELIVQEAQADARPSGGRRRFVAVRFGNVLGSRGSVVPLFQSQIEAGGPVTVTHPEMTRYFMTIPEAVQLVLQAAAHRARRRGLRARHGRAGEDRGPGARHDPPGGAHARARTSRSSSQGCGRARSSTRSSTWTRSTTRGRCTRRSSPRSTATCPKASRREGLDAAVDRLLDAARAHDTAALYDCIRALVPECAETLGACGKR